MQLYVSRRHNRQSSFSIIHPVVEKNGYGLPPTLMLRNHDFGESPDEPQVNLVSLDLKQLGKDLAAAAEEGESLELILRLI